MESVVNGSRTDCPTVKNDAHVLIKLRLLMLSGSKLSTLLAVECFCSEAAATSLDLIHNHTKFK
jgi:hypothetical protein